MSSSSASRDSILSLSELERLAGIGEDFGCLSDWLSLIHCLTPADRERIPAHLRTLAAKQIADEFARSPVRHEWIERVRELLKL